MRMRDANADEACTHGKAQRHVDSGNHPLKDDDAQHYPWSPVLFLEKKVTAGEAKRSVDA